MTGPSVFAEPPRGIFRVCLQLTFLFVCLVLPGIGLAQQASAGQAGKLMVHAIRADRQDACLVTGLRALNISGKKIEWELTNVGSDTVTIESIALMWPDQLGVLKKVELNGKIFDEPRAPPMTVIDSGWHGNTDKRQLDANKTKKLKFEFDENTDGTVETDYTISVSFEEGCTVLLTTDATGCLVMGAEPLKVGNKKIEWKLRNFGPDQATLDRLTVMWPDENGNLRKVELKGKIFEEDRPPPSTMIDQWRGKEKDRRIDAGKTKKLKVEFREKYDEAAVEDYFLRAEFVEGCAQSTGTTDTDGEVTIVDPASGLVTAATEVDVSGTVARTFDAVHVNGVAAQLSGGSFVARSVPLAEGTNRLTATASSASGEAASDSISVRRDTSPPLVVIETPRGGDRLVSDTITVAGTVNDIIPGATVNEDDVTVTVNGLPAAVDNRTFIVADLPLALDENTITATATDRAGNVSSTSIAVTREPDLAGIRIVINQGNTQTGPVGSLLPVPLGVQVLDEAGLPIAGRPVAFAVSRGDGLLANPADNIRSTTLLTDANGEATLDFTLGSRTGEGFHRTRVTTPGSLTFAEFCATAQPSLPVNIAIARPVSASGVAGQELSDALAVIVTDGSGNSVPGVDVTFEVSLGGGSFGDADSVVVATDPDGIAFAEWTLGAAPGRANNLASATFAGNPGLPAAFIVSGLGIGAVEDTQVSGVVQDSTGNAIEGAKAVIRGTPLEALTGPDGAFTISGVPPGGHRVGVVGSQANDVGAGVFFPDIDFAIEAVSGANNELDQFVVLPFLDMAGAKLVGGNEDVILEMQGVPGFGVRVFANSVILPDGTRGELMMSSSQVKFDKVPMPPPQGSTPLVVGTLQPSGIHFDPPAQVIYPNVEGLAPGDVADIFAFHHDIGQFVNVGPGTVSEDGSVVVSDPGFGIVESGWHCLIRLPGQTSNCANCSATVTSDGTSITAASPLVLGVGEDAAVQVTFSPAGTLEGSWSSANSATASVTGGAVANATVTGVAMGTTTITTPTNRTPAPDPNQPDITCETVFPVQVVTLELVTPAGDPVAMPVGSGDGQNEFSFSPAAPGVLTIDFKAKITPSSPQALSAIRDRVKFTVGTIGSSTMAWDAANPDGMATVSGDFLVATATFTGLPANNTDFGTKQVTVELDGTQQDSVNVEVFYDATATNHPGGDPTQPNWFHYYKQNEGGTTYTYTATGRSNALVGVPGSVKIGNEAYVGDEYIETTVTAGQLTATGPSGTNKFYANFIGVLSHEREHANNQTTAGPPTDRDGDFLSNNFETTTSQTDPDDQFSARGVLVGNQFIDAEVYAGGPVEQAGVAGASTSQDWANPGSNSL